jgi:hypothetical protein
MFVVIAEVVAGEKREKHRVVAGACMVRVVIARLWLAGRQVGSEEKELKRAEQIWKDPKGDEDNFRDCETVLQDIEGDSHAGKLSPGDVPYEEMQLPTEESLVCPVVVVWVMCRCGPAVVFPVLRLEPLE